MRRDPETWCAGRGRWQRLGLAALAGALMSAGHAPVDLPWTLFVALPVLVWLTAGTATPGAAFWTGWAAGVGYFATGLHWILHPFQVRAAGAEGLMAALWTMGGVAGVLAMAAGLALFWALAFWVARRVWPGRMLAGAVLLVALWSLVEYARGNVLTGFPWALPGYVWVETPVVQVASVLGAYGLTVLTLLLTALPGVALVRGAWGPGGLAVAALAGLWTWGAMRVPAETAYPDDPLIVRLVQPNAPQAEKWVPGRREIFYQRALDATAAPPDPDLGPPDVVIWPETAIYWLPAYNPEEVARISQMAGGVPVLLGALHGEEAEGQRQWWNALFVINRDGTLGRRYDKHHLVPFGEYIPFSGFFDLFGVEQFAQSGSFGAGPGPETLSIEGLPAFSPLICYEAIFPQEIVVGERPKWLLQITNDAWFGAFAGPQQHLDQARVRAIEQGLPLARAANTGISAMIDPHGRINYFLQLDESGKIDTMLPSPLSPTIYSLYGDLPALSLIVLLAIFAGLRGIIPARR